MSSSLTGGFRGGAGGRTVFDTTRAVYCWEWAGYPQYYVPLDDVDRTLLTDEDEAQQQSRGTAHEHSLRVGDSTRSRAARVYGADAIDGIRDTVRFRWDALDAWYEEDEEVFVHPRNPYTRVDALRSSRSVRIELDGVLLAESAAPVLVFETGLPTRYYLPRLDVRMDALRATDTRTECPYKGRTSEYWDAVTPAGTTADVAWSYAFPTRQLLPIAGLVGFLGERVDVSSVLSPISPDRRLPGRIAGSGRVRATDGIVREDGTTAVGRTLMLALVLLLVLVWVILAVVGILVKGLVWLTVVAAVLFLATLVFGGTRMRRRSPTR